MIFAHEYEYGFEGWTRCESGGLEDEDEGEGLELVRWATATTYKWQCCGGKNTCGISNTTDQNHKFPRCSGQACNHLKCAKCTDLKDMLGKVGEWGGISEPGSALPVVDPVAEWYCCKCGSGLNNMHLTPSCLACGHIRCSYCIIR